MDGYIPMHEFKVWCQKVIPLVYDESLSYMEVLCKVLGHLNKMITNMNVITNQVDTNTTNITNLQKDMDILEAEFEKVKNGDYVSLYINSLANWIDNNLITLVGRVVKYVFFGLTDDGYFCAYIPSSWDFISFDTVIDTESPLYGHLLLRW